jgi:hypothetical protein
MIFDQADYEAFPYVDYWEGIITHEIVSQTKGGLPALQVATSGLRSVRQWGTGARAA